MTQRIGCWAYLAPEMKKVFVVSHSDRGWLVRDHARSDNCAGRSHTANMRGLGEYVTDNRLFVPLYIYLEDTEAA